MSAWMRARPESPLSKLDLAQWELGGIIRIQRGAIRYTTGQLCFFLSLYRSSSGKPRPRLKPSPGCGRLTFCLFLSLDFSLSLVGVRWLGDNVTCLLTKQNPHKRSRNPSLAFAPLFGRQNAELADKQQSLRRIFSEFAQFHPLRLAEKGREEKKKRCLGSI